MIIFTTIHTMNRAYRLFVHQMLPHHQLMHHQQDCLHVMTNHKSAQTLTTTVHYGLLQCDMPALVMVTKY